MQAKSSIESEADKKGMVVEVLSPNRNKGKKRKFKQSKIQIHGEKNKLVIKLPEQDSESSSGPKKTQPKATSSPICIDLDSTGDKSSRSAHSSKSGCTTRNSSKRKAEDEVPQAKKSKKAKKEVKKKKSAHDKGKQNGSQPAKPKEETLNDFLKKKDLKKWIYVIDMVSPEDIEAIDILITQRRNEAEASLDKEIKEEPEGEKPVLKDGKQTDGSCDRTTGSGTDATDARDATDTKKGKQHKKRIRRKLDKEFIVYVGEERTKMQLVECSNSNSLHETSESDFQILGSASNSNSEESASNSNSEDSDKSGKNSNSEESDKSASNSNSEDSDKSGKNSNSEESDKSGSNSNSDGSDKSAKNSNSEETTKESEVSVEEIEVPPKSFPIYDVDSSSNSEKTEDIYKSHMDGSKISLATVSTEPYTQADESVEVLAKTMVTEQSTTFPYSQSDESIQFVSEEERQDKKESEEKNVTDATDEKEDMEDGQESDARGKDSVDKGAPSPVPVSPVENNREQVKYSVDKGPPSPVLVSPVENNGEQVKYSVDKGPPSPVPVSPVENNREQVKYSVDKGAPSPACFSSGK